MIKNILQSLIASKYNRIVKSNQNSPPNKITEKLQKIFSYAILHMFSICTIIREAIMI